MSNMEDKEFEKLINTLCDGVNTLIENNKFLLISNKKKLSAISAFLEFIKAGADVEAPVIEGEKVKFTVVMK